MTPTLQPPPDLRETRRPEIVLVAAIARNGAIGRGNELVWRNADDLRRLRRVTIGTAVLMGRKTWDSLPARFRPLPERRNLVLTRQPAWNAAGAEPVGSIASALAAVDGATTLSVIGGAELYRLALPVADRLVLTEIDADLPGDTFFPEWDRAAFEPVDAEDHRDDAGIGFRFATYRRRRSTAPSGRSSDTGHPTRPETAP